MRNVGQVHGQMRGRGNCGRTSACDKFGVEFSGVKVMTHITGNDCLNEHGAEIIITVFLLK